ncbi:hypothetical protein D9M68_615180 [compost metagenome]
MHHHRAGKVMEGRAGNLRNPVLDPVALVPRNAFEERVDKADQHECRHQLRIEARTFGNTARDNRRNGGGKSRQEKELDQVVTAFLGQRFCPGHELHAVGNGVADKEIGNRGNCEIHQNLYQCIDLVFLAHRAQLEESKAGVHGQHHDGAKQDKHGVGAGLPVVHSDLMLKMGA